MKKKLIFITEALWIGGIETALVNLLNRLDYDRYDVTVLMIRDVQDMAGRLPKQCRLIVADRQHAVTFAEPYRYRRLYNLMEEPQHATRLRRLIWHVLRLTLRAPEARLYSAYLKRQLGGEAFDTAVIYSDRTAEPAVRAVNAGRFLLVYHHGAMRREYHDGYGYRRAEKIIAVSEALADKLRAYRPRYAGKIVAINNLTDIDGVRAKSLEAPEVVFPQGQFPIVSCGRLAEAKGMDLAVDACARLVAAGCADVHWWIVGGGPEEAALRAQIRRLGMEEHVTLLGMQANPYPYIRQAELYVQPSRFEAFGLTIAEAMLLRKPIVTTNTDGSRELVLDGVTGTLCAADGASIAAAVRALYDAPQTRDRYRQALGAYDFEADNRQILQRWTALL